MSEKRPESESFKLTTEQQFEVMDVFTQALNTVQYVELPLDGNGRQDWDIRMSSNWLQELKTREEQGSFPTGTVISALVMGLFYDSRPAAAAHDVIKNDTDTFVAESLKLVDRAIRTNVPTNNSDKPRTEEAVMATNEIIQTAIHDTRDPLEQTLIAAYGAGLSIRHGAQKDAQMYMTTIVGDE